MKEFNLRCPVIEGVKRKNVTHACPRCVYLNKLYMNNVILSSEEDKNDDIKTTNKDSITNI